LADKEKKPMSPRKGQDDPLWNALAQVKYPTGVPKKERSTVGYAANELRKKGATEEEIRRRWAVMERKFPDKPCSLYCLVNHWDQLVERKASNGRIRTLENEIRNAKRTIQERLELGLDVEEHKGYLRALEQRRAAMEKG